MDRGEAQTLFGTCPGLAADRPARLVDAREGVTDVAAAGLPAAHLERTRHDTLDGGGVFEPVPATIRASVG